MNLTIRRVREREKKNKNENIHQCHLRFLERGVTVSKPTTTSATTAADTGGILFSFCIHVIKHIKCKPTKSQQLTAEKSKQNAREILQLNHFFYEQLIKIGIN